jgi:putative ABC transport system permease protein
MFSFLALLFRSAAIAVRTVRRNKLRSGLTVLGITIGIAAVVTVTALAGGAREAIGAKVSSLGANILIIFPRATKASGARGDTAGSKLSERDVRPLERDSTSIAGASPQLRISSVVVYEGQNAEADVVGVRLAFFDIKEWKLAEGAVWTPEAEATAENVIVLGSDVASKLFGPVDPIGRWVRIGKATFQVIGVLVPKGTTPFGEDQDKIAILPITTVRGSLVHGRADRVTSIVFSATSRETTQRARRQAEGILRQRHRIEEGGEDDFVVRSQGDLEKLGEVIFGALTALLVAVAGVSLVVGGIGVMNIMLVSVTERTREIGIRMAIGAREGDIMIQFLVESVVLALIGGIVGTIAGFGLIEGLSVALEWEMTVSPLALVVALATSSTIGLVFGFFPARRAAQMDPIKALRQE